MQVTDQEIISRRIDNWVELRDGLQTFCTQGTAVVEMLVMRGQEESCAGRPVDYDLYEITVHETPEHMDLTEVTQFANLPLETLDKYRPVLKEYWDSQASAYARYMQLVIQYNHF